MCHTTTGSDLQQLASWPGVADAAGTYRAPWVCRRCRGVKRRRDCTLQGGPKRGVHGAFGGKARRAAGERGPRGGRTEVQSLLFPLSTWNEDGARIWAGTHGFRDRLRDGSSNADVTGRYIRLRQAAPGKFKRLRTKVLSRKPLVKAIIGVR